MVCLTDMEDKLEDFFKDSERFKGNKLIVDFEVEEFNVKSNDFVVEKPKLKKGQKAAKFVKNNPNKKSLF
jgi:hypothetical protein|tara:strand:+ start:102 stop:311 length:210 start_codon:yes stop_codon:yes gene_type:complete